MQDVVTGCETAGRRMARNATCRQTRMKWAIIGMIVGIGCGACLCRERLAFGQAAPNAAAAHDADAALREANQLAEAGKYDDAAAAYERALAVARQEKHRRLEADALSELAVMRRKQGDEDDSLRLQKMAVDMYAELGDPANQAKALRRIGVVYRYQGHLSEAIAVLRQALALLTQIDDLDGIAQVLTNLGIVYGELGRLEDSKAQFERARRIYTAAGNQEGVSYTLADLGQLLLYFGDSRQALTALNTSLSIKEGLADERRKANTLLNIGTAHKNLGDFQQALTLSYQALAIYRSRRDQSGASVALGNIGALYEELGDYEQASQYLRESLDAKRQGGSPMQISIALVNLASLAIQHANFAEADAYLREALTLAVAQQSEFAQANIYAKLGALYLRQRQFDAAVAACSHARQLYQQIGSKMGELEAVSLLGEIAFRQERFPESLTFYEDALRLAEMLNDMSSLWTAQYYLGKIRLQSGEEEAAMRHFQASITTLEQMRSYLNVPELRQSFMRQNLNPYIEMMKILLRHGQDREALLYLERLKARTFLEMVAHGEPELRAEASALQEEQRLTAKIRYLSERISGGIMGESAQYDELAQELHQAKEAYEQLLLHIKLTYPEYYRLKIVDAEDMRGLMEKAVSLLEPDMTVLEYFFDDTTLYIWVITPQAVEAVEYPVGAEQIIETVLRFRRELSEYESLSIAQPLQALYSWVITPVEPHLAGKKIIGIVPYHALHFVPFGALVAPDAEQITFLIERYAMFSLPSLCMLPMVRERTESRTQNAGFHAHPAVLGIGNASENLPGAAGEMRALREYFPASTVYTGEQATKDRLFQDAGRYDVIHLALHGVFDKQHPLFSRVDFFSSALYAREIFGLRLAATLVTLSGCETLLPQQVSAGDADALLSGDELVGFIRAFMYAGTPTVLASLWRVNDSATQQLMSAFYRKLPEVGKAEALQYARMSVMRSSLQLGRRKQKEVPLIHPFFWASFELIGDWK